MVGDPPPITTELHPTTDAHVDDEYEDDDGASMQLMERVALAVVGLLAMGLLAWLGRACIGG